MVGYYFLEGHFKLYEFVAIHKIIYFFSSWFVNISAVDDD